MEVRRKKKDFKKHTDNNFLESELFTELARQCACGFSYDLCRDFWILLFSSFGNMLTLTVLSYTFICIVYKIRVIVINSKLHIKK